MKNINVINNTRGNITIHDVAETYDCYMLCVTGSHEISIIWDDGGNDYYLVGQFRGESCKDDAMEMWYGIIDG